MLKSIKNWFLWVKRRTEIRSRVKRVIEKIRTEKELAKMNQGLKDTHKGERCFILGTGPSIKNQDITLLKNEQTFAVAGFYLHHDYDIIHPKFFCIIDVACFGEDKESKKFIENIAKKVHEDTSVILPFSFKNAIEKRGLFAKNKKIYLSQNSRSTFRENGHFNIDIDKQIPVLVNVVFSAMITANYMGFKTMYLLGVEHDWLAKRSCTPEANYFQDQHFYEEDEFPKIPLLTTFVPYEKICISATLAYKTHRLLKQKMPDVQIFNLTPGSYLDVFPFQRYEDVAKGLNDNKDSHG
ncbi:MAG: hypothetical protein M0P76_03250 [Candidatus Pacebacteria bacterium]|jgi:hypothetical protein|nr:hypothetical protein [Candidatus Paceibacterota bacterium]